MGTQVKIVITILILINIPGAMLHKDIIKQMTKEMNQPLSIDKKNKEGASYEFAIIQNELSAIKADLASAHNELTTIKVDFMTTKDELAITKHDLASTKLDLKKAMHNHEAKEEELKKEIKILKNPPFIHFCGYQRSTSVTVQTITYSTLLYSSTNTEGGGLDIETGIFTSPHPGNYTVTWALFSNSGHGDHDHVYLPL